MFQGLGSLAQGLQAFAMVAQAIMPLMQMFSDRGADASALSSSDYDKAQHSKETFEGKLKNKIDEAIAQDEQKTKEQKAADTDKAYAMVSTITSQTTELGHQAKNVGFAAAATGDLDPEAQAILNKINNGTTLTTAENKIRDKHLATIYQNASPEKKAELEELGIKMDTSIYATVDAVKLSDAIKSGKLPASASTAKLGYGKAEDALISSYTELGEITNNDFGTEIAKIKNGQADSALDSGMYISSYSGVGGSLNFRDSASGTTQSSWVGQSSSRTSGLDHFRTGAGFTVNNPTLRNAVGGSVSADA